jgi:predicted ester cyclase
MRIRKSVVTTVALAALAVGGLTGAARDRHPHPTSLVGHNTELGREFVALENERDGAARQRLAARIVAPDYVQHNAIIAPGRAGLLAFLQSLPTVMPNVHFTSRDVFATATRVVSRFTITGTVTGGPFLGVAPAGQQLEWDGVDVWTVQGGRLYEHWDQFDWPRVFVELGIKGLPQPFVQAAAKPVNR